MSEQHSNLRVACPNCGLALQSGAAICTSCGCNTQTGQMLSTKVDRPAAQPSTPNENSESGRPNQSGDIAMGILKPVIGACVGGAIGAALWAAIAYYFNYEVGYVAILVGLLTGFGAVVGAGGGGEIVAFIALVVAVLSIGTGKYIAINAYLKYKADPLNISQIEIEDLLSPHNLTEYELMQYMVDVHASERLEQGEIIDWPNPDTTLETAYWPEDYPDELVEYTTTTWENMDIMERQRVQNAASDFYIEIASDDPESFFTTEPIAFANVLDTMNFYDIIWLIAAMYGTWHVAARDY